MSHALVVRNGLVIDGSGRAPFEADIAVDDGIITAMGPGMARGAEEIDAKGRVVTPGFVDLHTHYDAQALWDPELGPSAWHGVTTVITGNCSVGFAPLRPAGRSFPLQVLEAVEEIPRAVMEAGIDFDWETYPEYLDALGRRRHTLDIGTQVTHIALRAYVMGERAERDEPATGEDLRQMCELAGQALQAGALGIGGSRTKFHRYPGGGMVPGTLAEERELLALAATAGRVGGRVVQYLGDATDLDHDIPFTLELARTARVPVHFIMSDTGWERRLALISDARAEGLTLYGHIAPRAVGVLAHWRAIEHPFHQCPAMQGIARDPWERRLARLRDPEFKARVLSEAESVRGGPFHPYSPDRMFELGDYPDYEPDPATDSIAARAAQAGVSSMAYAYDVMTAGDGDGFLYTAIANYRPGDFSLTRQLLTTENILVSLADGGAHCTRVCDSATPTFMLAHWARDRKRGDRLPAEQVVRSLTRDLAAAYGLHDRGLLAPGYLADINVIDFDHLALPRPRIAHDFPNAGLRLVQDAEGYNATIKRGQVTFRDGQHCGTYPGQVIRGSQPQPAQHS
jgi:N-acyl-D-aspartate/D-glutamate deacylase